MSLALVVMCDDPSGCGITAAAHPPPWPEYAEFLRREGWTVGDRRGDRDRQITRDLCPDCTNRREEAKQ
ncbi:hypothetical protein ABT369_28340 [Dactylosporangium sp. NPDC000244]|uniref:hypothetical protein n=1 Tax=Dactylosporangium sp. NPDC000244 TaxID=3154365 RepID=UPI00332BE2C0